MDLLWYFPRFSIALYRGRRLTENKAWANNSESECFLCQVRPPGHHAMHATAMGFCLHNNAAIAAKAALTAGVKRVMIVDWVCKHILMLCR